METEIKEIIKKKLKELEEKSRLYKLKRYEKNCLKKYRNILFYNDKKELIVEQMKRNQEKFEKKLKEEKETFFKEKESILKEKKETIKLIENEKINTIQEINKKYKNIISYLDTIKNDRKKLIEFFKNNINYIN
jgi:DNA relaxase NicK